MLKLAWFVLFTDIYDEVYTYEHTQVTLLCRHSLYDHISNENKVETAQKPNAVHEPNIKDSGKLKLTWYKRDQKVELSENFKLKEKV